LWKYLSTNPPYRKGDVVSGRVYELGHDFGTFVAVDDKYNGMIPRHEKNETLHVGDMVTVRVTGVKEDGKLDLSMREDAYKEIQNDGDVIMELLDSYAGTLPFTEKTSPEVILRETGMSKAAFKRAVGHLYNERKIVIEVNNSPAENMIRKSGGKKLLPEFDKFDKRMTENLHGLLTIERSENSVKYTILAK
jgi:predicted RNA-binding protein (virulence factor B family)